MTASLAFDVGVVALVLAVAGWTIAARSAFAAAIGFVAYGLALALAWVRVGAPDVALTEAAIGGVTGVLLLSAAARLRGASHGRAELRPGPVLRVAAALGCALVSAGVAAVVLAAPDPAPTLAPRAAEPLASLELGNPVTAVLMAYRAVDTLLEKVVLLVAVVALWSLAPDRVWGGRPGPAPAAPDEALVFLARVLPPAGIVAGAYLLWTATREPGGAFAGGALLAAMWVLARLAGLVDAPAVGGRRLRLALVLGPAALLVAGFAGHAWAGDFLAWPDGLAKPLIVAVEVAMTLTIAATVAMLVEGPPTREPER